MYNEDGSPAEEHRNYREAALLVVQYQDL